MNLEPETRKGYYISAEMKRLWAVEMELLNKLLEVCKKHNLQIYAEGGTLLGAVREHGYIPWDDDIDMAMPREDYDKLRSIAKDEFKSPYFFQCGYTDLFPNGQTKIRRDGTTAILIGDIMHNFHQGVFIDVFPLDSIPEKEDEYNNLIKSRINIRAKLLLFLDYNFSLTNWKYNWEYLKVYFSIRKNGFKSYFQKYDEIIKQYQLKQSHLVSLLSWNDDKRYIRDKSWYKGTIYMPFEDIMIPVPTGYKEILSKQYGDYMKPAKVPNQHGSFVVLDLNKSYLDYLPSLIKQHKWDNWKNKWNRLRNL